MTDTTQALPVTHPPSRSRWRLRPSTREAIWGYVFIGPWLIGLALFTAGPIIASLVMSLTNFDLLHADQTQFIGLDNYVRMTKRPARRAGADRDLQVRADRHPRHDAREPRLRPPDEPPEAVGQGGAPDARLHADDDPARRQHLVWIGFLNTETGWLNKVLEAVGLPGPDWISSEIWIYPALTLMGLWAIGNFMIINIAGLQSVPTELYEAARIDGAGWWTQLRRITIPLISPVLLYDLVIILIATFQYFTQAYTLTNGRGDPNNATLFINLELFREAFVFSRMGYGAAIAWLLFAIVLVLTIALFAVARRRVYYAGGER